MGVGTLDLSEIRSSAGRNSCASSPAPRAHGHLRCIAHAALVKKARRNMSGARSTSSTWTASTTAIVPIDDERLLQHLVKRRMGLTVCPLSNLRLVRDRRHGRGIRIADAGGAAAQYLVTVNSDDSRLFRSGYINEQLSSALAPKPPT